MARRSSGSQRKSVGRSANFDPQKGRSGVRNYFLKAVERGAAKGEMTAYGKTINAVVATGTGVEVVEVQNAPFSQRSLIAKHWNLTTKLLEAQSPKEFEKATRDLQRFVNKHGSTGGLDSREFASDPNDIINAAMADPDAMSKGPYPEGAK